MGDVTRLQDAAEAGDALAAEKLFPLAYDELKMLTAQRIAREKPGQTLDATALVHEGYVTLVERTGVAWNSASWAQLSAPASRITFSRLQPTPLLPPA